MTINNRQHIAALSSVLVHILLFIFFKVYKNTIITKKKTIEIENILLFQKEFSKENDYISDKNEIVSDITPACSPLKTKSLNQKKSAKTSPIIKNEADSKISPVEEYFKNNKDSDMQDGNISDGSGEIDERSLYEPSPNNIESDGVVLNIEGWDWNDAPSPKDTTDETGTIVFEITIDDQGYVIGIKTLKKNVSAKLEAIYRESLENISFRKKSSNNKDNNTTKGTVSFCIVGY